MYTKLVGTYGQGHAQMHIDWLFPCSLSSKICCYSSAVLHEMWWLWRCEGKKVLEAPTGRLPNGRVDIYPGRLWAVAAAPTEMIQPAIWNIGFYSDGWSSYCARSGDVWGLCTYILSLNLPTHSVWHRCCRGIERRCWQSSCIVHDGMGIAWWRNKAQHVRQNKDNVFHHALLNHTCKMHVSGRRRDEHLNTKRFQSMFVFTSKKWLNPASVLSCFWGSQWFVSACCCYLKLDSGRQYNTDQAKSYAFEILLSIYKLVRSTSVSLYLLYVQLYFKLHLTFLQ